MRRISLIAFILLSINGLTQTLSEPTRLFPKANFRPPQDTVISPVFVGELRYKASNAKFYKSVSLTGAKWSEFGVSGVAPSFQDVTTVGSTTNTGINLLSNNSTSGFLFGGVVANYGSQYMGYGLNSSDLTNRVSNTHGGIAVLYDTRSGIPPYRMFLYPAGSGTSKQVFAVDEGGAVSLPQYGTGAVTGTATYYLAINSSGKIIEQSGSTLNRVVNGLTNKTANYTIVGDDVQCFEVNAASGAVTITLPNATSLQGRVFTIKKVDNVNTVTVATSSSQTIDNASTYLLSTQWKYVTMISNGSNWLVIGNN